ncbi:MAG: antitoxin [Chloroflexi bacterium]|nr:MAG: antitoxin [Chloroflexota bacterium]
MQTKLTLRLDKRLIDQAKHYARQRNRSLSQIVEDFFALLPATFDSSPPVAKETLPPITQSLYGLLQGTTIDEQDYRDHLEEKYS